MGGEGVDILPRRRVGELAARHAAARLNGCGNQCLQVDTIAVWQIDSYGPAKRLLASGALPSRPPQVISVEKSHAARSASM